MRFEFADPKLRMLYMTGKGRFGTDVILAFFRVMGHIDQAVDERDLRALKGLRYEKLKRDRAGHYSLLLNDQFRLIVRPIDEAQGRTMWIIEIVGYH